MADRRRRDEVGHGSKDRAQVPTRGRVTLEPEDRPKLANPSRSVRRRLALVGVDAREGAGTPGEDPIRASPSDPAFGVRARSAADVATAGAEVARPERAAAGDLLRAGASARRGDADGLHLGSGPRRVCRSPCQRSRRASRTLCSGWVDIRRGTRPTTRPPRRTTSARGSAASTNATSR